MICIYVLLHTAWRLLQKTMPTENTILRAWIALYLCGLLDCIVDCIVRCIIDCTIELNHGLNYSNCNLAHAPIVFALSSKRSEKTRIIYELV